VARLSLLERLVELRQLRVSGHEGREPLAQSQPRSFEASKPVTASRHSIVAAEGRKDKASLEERA